MAQIRATELDPQAAGWADDVDRLRALAGAPANPALFPPHFLKATFPKIGGRMLEFRCRTEPAAVGFLYPRALDGRQRVYTLRLHPVPASARLDGAGLLAAAEQALGADRCMLYFPAAPHRFEPSAEPCEGLEYGAPAAAEATAVRALQREIWDPEPDYLYPADLHAADFRPGTSLVARDGERTVGFLFGFFAFGGPRLPAAWSRHLRGLRVESQLLGVLPEYRRQRVGYHLKRFQAAQARAEDVGLVSWTVDPLNFPNAVLNFGRLRAVALHFYPDFYPFRNALNRVSASRFGITWLVDSRRVREALAARATEVPDLARADAGPRLHLGAAAEPLRGGAERVAVEIPTDWGALQRDDPAAAQAWRAWSDPLFRDWLGGEDGRYVVTGVAQAAERRYLLLELATPALLEALGA